MNFLSMNLLLQGLLAIIIILVFIYIALKIRNLKLTRTIGELDIRLNSLKSRIEEEVNINNPNRVSARKVVKKRLGDLEIGLEVAKPVKNKEGETLIQAGSKLNLNSIQLIAENNLSEIDVFE